MSLFGSLMGEFDDDIFGNQMNAMNMQMRSMNRLMNSFMPDPFNMLTNFDSGFQQNALMERQGGHNMGGLFGFPTMPNMNRLLSADIGNNGTSFCSSSVITMSSGPDGRPQIYQASSSTKTGPGGIRETRRSVQDSLNGVKKMAIGHHIGERAHIIEKEQDLRSGQLEERQEFINLEEEEAEDFDREFTTKARSAIRGRGNNHGYAAIAAPPPRAITIEPIEDDDEDDVAGDIAQQANVRPPHRQPTTSSSHNARRQMPAPSVQQNSAQNSSTTENAKTSATTTTMSPSSKIITTTTTTKTTNIKNQSTASSTLSECAANANETAPTLVSPPSQQSSRRINYHYRGSHLISTSPRRSIRTPASSPLIISSPIPSLSKTYVATSSVHPHPYNTSAARRNHHRSKQHSKSQQQQQEQQKQHNMNKQESSTKQK